VLNDGRAPDTDDAPVERFWRALGVGNEPSSAQVAVSAHPAIQYAHPMVFAVMRDLSLCFVHEGATPARALLHSDNAYIVDCLNEIYVWVGKSSDLNQRKRALRVAKLMRTRVDLEGHRRCDVHGEPFARIMRVIEDGEPMIFRERFTGFPGMLPINMTRVEKASKVAKRREQPRIDIPALLDAPRAPLPDIAAAGPGDDGELVGPPVFPTSGPGVTIKVWVIEEFDKRPVRRGLWPLFRRRLVRRAADVLAQGRAGQHHLLPPRPRLVGERAGHERLHDAPDAGRPQGRLHADPRAAGQGAGRLSQAVRSRRCIAARRLPARR
jgi:hypothetical protein